MHNTLECDEMEKGLERRTREMSFDFEESVFMKVQENQGFRLIVKLRNWMFRGVRNKIKQE